MAKKSRALIYQKIFVILLFVVSGSLLLTLIWSTFRMETSSDFIEGRDYQLIEKPRRIRGEKIEVIEFFSYGCVHCYRFEPVLAAWVPEKKDTIKFFQTPAVMSKYWELLGKHYYTLMRLKELDNHHMGIFHAIHSSGQDFDSEEKLFEFVKKTGIDFDSYLKMFESTEVSADIQKARQMARRLRISAVPAIVVHGKYLVQTSREIGLERVTEVVSYLIAKEVHGTTLMTNKD